MGPSVFLRAGQAEEAMLHALDACKATVLSSLAAQESKPGEGLMEHVAKMRRSQVRRADWTADVRRIGTRGEVSGSDGTRWDAQTPMSTRPGR